MADSRPLVRFARSRRIVQERLGHHGASFTLDAYGHVTAGMQAQAAATLAGLVDGGGA